jgi:hypothetical protein
MAAIFAFKCSCCGERHEGSPSFSFRAPDPYSWLTEDQRQGIAQISDDLCVIRHEERTDYFIRAVLEIPILGISEPFVWGVWVSASQESFESYVKTFDNPTEGDGFFGWLCNEIDLYPTEQFRPADVYIQLGGQRPKVVLHSAKDEADQLVIDQLNGITIERAQRLAEQAMHQ